MSWRSGPTPLLGTATPAEQAKILKMLQAQIGGNLGLSILGTFLTFSETCWEKIHSAVVMGKPKKFPSRPAGRYNVRDVALKERFKLSQPRSRLNLIIISFKLFCVVLNFSIDICK